MSTFWILVVFTLFVVLILVFWICFQRMRTRSDARISSLTSDNSKLELRCTKLENISALLRKTAHDLGAQNTVLKQGEERLFLFRIDNLEPAGTSFFAPFFMNTKTGTLTPVTDEWRMIGKEIAFATMVCRGQKPIQHEELFLRGIQHMENLGVVSILGEEYRFPSGNPLNLDTPLKLGLTE